MSSRHRHDNKQALRVQAQQRRAAQAQERAEVNAAAPELFAQPIRVHPNNHDFTAERIKHILGDYEQVQPNLHKSSLLGVARGPGTPQPSKSGTAPPSFFVKPSPNGTHKDASHKVGLRAHATGFGNNAQKAGSSAAASSSGWQSETSTKWPSCTSVRKSETTDKRTDRHRTKYNSGRPIKSESSPDRTVKVREKSVERVDASRHTGATTAKSSHGRTSSHKSPSSASSRHTGNKSLHAHDSKHVKDTFQHDPPELVKHLSPHLSPIHSSPENEDHGAKDCQISSSIIKSPSKVKVEEPKMAPPNGTIPVNGLTKKHRHNLPKIHIHMEGKPPSDPSSSVDDIIKEMTRIDPPLTGISTPHKEKNFPFPSGHPDPHSRLQVTKQLMDSTVHRSGNDKAHGDLSNELEVSESENEGEDGTKCDESINKPVAETQGNRSPEPEVRMSSSSDSESEESSGTSSDSGSDSESSASDGEEESVTAPPKEEPKEKVSPVETSNPSVEQTSEQQNTKLRWSLSTFLMPKTNTSIIGSDIGLCDTLKDTTDSGLGDLTDSLLKSTGKSNELIPDLRADIDLPGHDSDFETHTKVRQTKKDHKTTKHKDRSSSSAESQAISSHKRASETRSPGRGQAKSPAPALQETPTVTKSPATKKGPRKNSTASEKSSKSETHKSSKSKNGLCDEKLSNVSAKSNRKAGTAASKPEGRPRGRPRSKPKTPVLLSSDSSDEEEMDVDVVSISPEKMHTPMARKISVDHADVAEKSEVSKNSTIKQTSPLQTSLSSLPSDKAKRKDSERKDKKERKKHDKQSEDKRKPKSSPLSDKENSKFSNQEKDITMSNFDVLMNDMSESPIPSVPPKSIPGVSYLDGKPSIVVRLNFSLLDRIPPNITKDTDLKSPESGISTMSSMSSNTCTTALSHPISGTLDSTDSREDDAHQDLLTDSFNDSAVEDDTPRLSSKHDSSRSSEVKLEVKCESSKDTCANDNTATTLLGNSCVTKESNGGSVGSIGSVPDPSEDIITQLWDSRPVQPVRKWKYPKDGGSESKHPKPSPKTTKRSEPSPMRDSKSRDDTEVEAKSPSKTSKRRSSTSSTSSHQSQKDKAKRRKCDKDSIVNKDKVERVKEEVVESKLKNGDSELRMTASPCLDISKGTMRASRLISNHRLLPAEDYLVEAKRLKHEADSLGDKKHRSLIYLEAVLSFILSGYAMEQEQICDSTRYFKMYTDTLALLKYTHMGRFRNNHHDSDGPGVEKQLTVLSLRIQSLLCLKLFKLKKAETLRLKKVIDDHNKMSSKPTASAPSPHQTSWNSRGTGTPSPMSPTPSPAGSIGSVGSQSSNCDVNPSKLANGNLSTGTLSSPGCVSVPQRIHSITSQYISHTSYLVQAMDLWDQGDAASAECGDFFERLELETKVLSLHSSIRELVHYVQRGLARLKDT